ncbi:MAG TPA: DUF2341 domain-containing protein [Bryobacteraceae bacterium]|nr:DUF2341 domain-containing protein [Bryobacteraceae bacterium]
MGRAVASATYTIPITVTVGPTTATLSAGQSQQFTATVANTSNTAVVWSIRPTDPGSINSAGVYTAPPAVATQQDVVVTATSQADGTALGTATVTLLPPPGNGYLYSRVIVIDHTKVANSDQTDFPVLISGTYSYLANVANGGKVQNTSGYDIIFTSDCAGANKLDHEIESYSATDGTVRMWVRIPSLSHTADTVLYMWYGNSAITSSQENRTGVWDTTFTAVYHLGNGITLSGADSTAGNHNGTIVGATAATGQVGGAANFVGSSGQYIDIGNLGARPVRGAISMWLKAPARANYPNAFTTAPLGESACGNAGIRFELHSDGYFGAATGADNASCTGGLIGPAFTNAFTVWHYVTVTWDSSANIETVYYDGTASLNTSNTYWATNFGSVKIGVGWSTSRYWSGQIDEVQLSNTNRSADWIATEYTNQLTPASFYTIYSENTVTVTVNPTQVSILGSQSQQFAAQVFGSCNTAVTWLVRSEHSRINYCCRTLHGTRGHRSATDRYCVGDECCRSIEIRFGDRDHSPGRHRLHLPTDDHHRPHQDSDGRPHEFPGADFRNVQLPGYR